MKTKVRNSLYIINEKHPIGAKAARSTFSDASRKYDSAKNALDKATASLNEDYGPDNIYLALRDTCVSTKAGQYKYEVCFFGKAKQDGLSLGYSIVVLGLVVLLLNRKWEGFLENGTKIKFSGGQKCWNGPARSLTVYS